jgi:hypothetical protein
MQVGVNYLDLSLRRPAILHGAGYALAGLLLSLPFTANAAFGYDLRLGNSLGSSGQNSAILRVPDCSELSNVVLNAGASTQTLTPQDATRVDGGTLACEFSILISNSEVLNISAQITSADDSISTYSESYVLERNPPVVAFDSVGFQTSDDGQLIVIQFDVSDDVDLRYLDVTASAIRASDVRKHSGIVENALLNAFAQSGGVVRVWPVRNDQTRFSLALPVTQALTDTEILRNGVVMIDAMAVDASGNAGSFAVCPASATERYRG